MDTASMFAMGAASQQMRSVASLYGGVKSSVNNEASSDNTGDKIIGDSIKQNVEFSRKLIEMNNSVSPSTSSLGIGGGHDSFA